MSRIARGDLIAAIVLLALLAVTAIGHFRVQNRLYDLDTLTFYIPWYTHMGDRLASGDVPGWYDQQFSGAPFAADPQSGWTYVPAMVAFLLVGGMPGYITFLLIHWILSSVFMYTLARMLGLRPAVSLFCATAFTFGTFMTHTHRSLLRSHLGLWLPLIMIGIELGVRSERKRTQVLGWTLTGLALSQVLAAWVGQGVYLAALFAAFYLLWRTIVQFPVPMSDWRTRMFRLITGGSVMFIVMASTGAAGLLPRLEWNPRTNLVDGNYGGVQDEAHGYPISRIIGHTLGYDNGQLYWYIGASTIVLALIGGFLAWRRTPVGFLVIVSALTVVLAMPDTPIHQVFYLLPKFETLHWHQPNRTLVILTTTMPLLAGFGLDSVLNAGGRRALVVATVAAPVVYLAAWKLLPEERQVLGWETFLAVAIVTVLLAACLVFTRDDGVAPGWVITWAIPLGFVLIAWWDPTGQAIAQAVRGSPPESFGDELAVGFAATEPNNGAEQFLVSSREDGEIFRYFGFDETHWVQSNPLSRWSYVSRFDEPEVLQIIPPPRAMLLGLDGIQGYNPVHILRYDEFFLAVNGKPQNYHVTEVLQGGINSPLLNLLNVRYVVVPSGADGGWDGSELVELGYYDRIVYSDDQVHILANDSSLPRVWIVHDVQQVEEGTAMAFMTDENFDPLSLALIETNAPPLAQPTGDEHANPLPTESSDTVAADVTLSADGLVVFSEVWDPNWVAYVDGERTDLLVADHILRAVPVPAGQHRIELRYESQALKYGLWISAVAWLGVIALAASCLFGRCQRL